MVITGKTGTGKSVFICDLVKNPQKNLNIWLQDSACLKMNQFNDLNSFVANSLGFDCKLTDLCATISNNLPENRILLIFDAINEYTEKENLLISISEFLNRIETTNIKVLITCRIPIWNVIRRNLTIPIEKEFHTAGPNSFVNIDVFSEHECEEVYNLYKEAYTLKSSFDELTEQVRHFLSQPLFLKLAAESYEGQELPNSLILHEVFSKYIIKCLGEDELESIEYKILHRTIKLMYDNAVREIQLSILKKDIEIGEFIVPIQSQDHFAHLLDVGLLSQKKIVEGLLQRIDVVFVTYERVFEFLLADLIIANLSEVGILKQLEIAQVKMFSQLRGAVELAVCFSIINKTSDISLIIKIAQLNRPDSRQFLCDVIQTIYQSGNRNLVDNIINELSTQVETEPKLLAVQASYQLKLDEKLIELTLYYDQLLRDIAALYIYERWNKARLDGNVNDGYQIIKKLVSRIYLKNPKISYNVLSAFLSISINMGVHVIDDPSSLKPLIEISKDLVKKIPGLIPDSTKSAIITIVSEKAAQVFIEIFSLYLSRIMKDENIFRNIFFDKNAKRALLDVGSLINLDDLTLYKEKVIKLISWDNPSVYFSSRSVLTCQVYLKPETHLDFLQDIYNNSGLSLQVRSNVLHAMIYGLISRLLNKKEIDEERLIPLIDFVFDILEEFTNLDSITNPDVHKVSQDDKILLYTTIQFLFFGVFYLDAYLLRVKGLENKSFFVEKYCHHSCINNSTSIEIIIWAIEKVGYQGFSEYSIFTLINPSFKIKWHQIHLEKGLTALSNLRSLFQDQFDSILQSDEIYRDLWDQVKSTGSFPNPKELWEVSYGIWIMVGTAVDTTIMKISGLVLMDLVLSSKSEEFIKRTVRTFLMILNDPEIIDIAHIQYGFSHNPNWNLFSRLNINKQLLNTKPEIHEYYKQLTNSIVSNYGRGILYDET
ncbi:MAG: hypothetical protein ABSD71_02345 [Bacteroidales bacterium]